MSRVYRNYPRRRKSLWYKRFGKAAFAPCFYCLSWVTLKTSTLDHRIARAQGGKNTWDNFEIACPFCNEDKNYFVERNCDIKGNKRMTLEAFVLLKRNKRNFTILRQIWKRSPTDFRRIVNNYINSLNGGFTRRKLSILLKKDKVKNSALFCKKVVDGVEILS
jgi:hypothetical protein